MYPETFFTIAVVFILLVVLISNLLIRLFSPDNISTHYNPPRPRQSNHSGPTHIPEPEPEPTYHNHNHNHNPNPTYYNPTPVRKASSSKIEVRVEKPSTKVLPTSNALVKRN